MRENIQEWWAVSGWFLEGDAMPAGDHVRQIIDEQTAGWREALRRARPLDRAARHVFSGSGSSYYVALAAAAVGRRLGLNVEAMPACELCLEPDQALRGVDHLLLISRSGATSEALWALSEARRLGLSVSALSADPESDLVAAVGEAEASPAWEDDAVVMVRSCTGFLLFLEASMAHSVGARPLDEREWVEGFQMARAAGGTLTEALVGVPRRLVILGAGVREGIAREGMLKVTEMAHVATATYHPMEFRHGPRGALSDQDWVVLLGQAAFAEEEARVLNDILTQGPRVAVVARSEWFTAAGSLAAGVARALLPDRPDDLWNGPLALVPLQVLAWELAIRAGEDPDAPANLSKVVRLEGREAPAVETTES